MFQSAAERRLEHFLKKSRGSTGGYLIGYLSGRQGSKPRWLLKLQRAIWPILPGGAALEAAYRVLEEQGLDPWRPGRGWHLDR